MANEEWALLYEEAEVKHLPKACLDHCPIILSTIGFAHIPVSLKPFIFQAAWLTHAKFEEFMRANWNNSLPLIPFLSEFAAKLNSCKETFHNIFGKRKSYGLA